jgi:hypothetical protein
MRYSPRFWAAISSVAILFSLALGLPEKPAFAADNVVFIFGGDVEWSLNARPPTVRYRVSDPAAYGKIVYGRRDVRDQVTGDWPPIPYIDQGESGAYLKSLGLKGPNNASTGESLSYPLLEREEYAKDYSTDDVLLNYPLQRLAPIFHGADLVMVNCEGALSDHGQPAPMQGASARQLLENLRNRSASLDTAMAIDGDKGVISVLSPQMNAPSPLPSGRGRRSFASRVRLRYGLGGLSCGQAASAIVS